MKRSLDRNPIAWLQQYSWQARLVKWGLCLAFLVIECVALLGDSDTFDMTQAALLLILAAAFTFVGVSSFLSEKRNGALELLLVTPISVNKIILGRACGLWKQFLLGRAAARHLRHRRPLGRRQRAVHLARHFIVACFPTSPIIFPPHLTLACLFLALPFCATYFALRVKNLIVAAVLTWIALFIPMFMAAALNWFEVDAHTSSYCFILLFSNFALVLLICFLLRHSLVPAHLFILTSPKNPPKI